MDILTQGLLGAATAQSGSVPAQARMAAAIGGVAGLLPDLDTLIQSPTDPLLFLDVHRHFTHAIVLVPVIALVASAFVWPLARKSLPFSRIYLYALLGCALAGTLDTFTSYGTWLLWPFLNQPLSLRIVAIVDPVVTVALAAGLWFGLRRRRRRPAQIALVVVAAYLCIGAIQHQRAYQRVQHIAVERGHQAQRIVVKPTMANIVLWRGLYVSNGRIYADAIQLPPFSDGRIYRGESTQLVAPGNPLPADDPLLPLTPVLHRFARFADGLIVRHPERPNMLGDARFAMLPTLLRPLWGITPAAADAGYPAEFVTDRSMSAHERSAFLSMLIGNPVH